MDQRARLAVALAQVGAPTSVIRRVRRSVDAGNLSGQVMVSSDGTVGSADNGGYGWLVDLDVCCGCVLERTG